MRTFNRNFRQNKNVGINIGGSRHAPIKAVADGVVVYSGNELEAYGKVLLVRHLGGIITVYAHNKKLLVMRGDSVVRGQPIALMGSTGSVVSTQLHFEIRLGSRVLNPMQCLPKRGRPRGTSKSFILHHSRYDSAARRSMDILVLTRPN